MFLKTKIGLCVFLISVLAEQCRATQEDKQKLLPDKETCGQQIATGTGTNAELGEFPWVVLLRYKDADGKDGGFRCLGCLINDRYVLTTATCVNPREVTLSEVRLGEHNLSTEKDCKDKDEKECSDPVKDYGVEDKIAHADFKKRSFDNDIALVRLNQSVKFTDYIKPICLPTADGSSVKPGDTVTASGWGRSITGDLITIKKRVLSTVLSKEECEEDYKKLNRTIGDNHLCTKSLRNNTNFICTGDSGGPLMVLKDDRWVQEGVVSFGVGCGYSHPDGNMKVQHYLDWILEKILP